MEKPNTNVAFSNILCYDKNMIEYYETSYELSVKKNADMEAILFGQEDCLPSHAYGPTVRPYHLIHFVTKGSGLLKIDGRIYDIHAGDAFLIPAEQVSYYEASRQTPWSYFWVGLTGMRASQYIRQILDAMPERYVLRGLNTEKYASVIRPIAALEGTSAIHYFHAQQALYTLFIYFAEDLSALRSPRYLPSLAIRVKGYLEAKYAEKLSITEVSQHFGVHPNHLSRAFREAFGLSPKQFLIERKLEKAAQLLTETDDPVGLIAFFLGFEDQHAFSKAFKKHYSVSPLAYRRQSRQ